MCMIIHKQVVAANPSHDASGIPDWIFSIVEIPFWFYLFYRLYRELKNGDAGDAASLVGKRLAR